MTVAIKLHHFVTECMSFCSQDKTSKGKEMACCHSKLRTAQKQAYPLHQPVNEVHCTVRVRRAMGKSQ